MSLESELSNFERIMADGVDDENDQGQDTDVGAEPAESLEDEAEVALGEAEPAGSDAEAEGADGQEVTASDGGLGEFVVPEGYNSAREFFEAQQKTHEQLKAQSEDHKQAALFAAQEHEATRAQLAALQQHLQRQGQPSWANPVQITPDVALAVKALELGNEDAFRKLPPEVQAQARQYVHHQRGMQQRLFDNPAALIQQVVGPMIEQATRPYREQLDKIRVDDFRRRHHELIGTPEGARELVMLSRRDATANAIEIMQLRRQVAAQASAGRNETRKTKDAQAKRNAARGTSRRPQRAGTAQAPNALTPEQAADPNLVAEQVLDELYGG